MTYGKFISYNVIGGIVWVAAFIYGGYFFGTIPVVKKNFTLVVIAIILISVAPMVFEFLKARAAAKRERAAGAAITKPE
jgi:membrane-associated protein